MQPQSVYETGTDSPLPGISETETRSRRGDLIASCQLVITRNSRLEQLVELRAPDIVVRNEKRMLRAAVNALIDEVEAVGIAAHLGININSQMDGHV